MAEPIKIGIWGGSGTGKTTFLAALRIALLKYAKNTRTQWNINGLDEINPRSASFLATNTRHLQSLSFPPATIDPTPATYTYEVNGSFRSNGMWEKLLSLFSNPKDVQFILSVFDYPGGHLLQLDEGDVFWEYLSGCQGLIYLFDPKNTEIGTGNFDCLQRSLDMMRRAFERRSPASIMGGRLPQHLAFCITKFDDDEVFRQLRNNGLIALDGSDSSHPPFVKDPEGAFECLADDLTVQTVRSYFHSGHVNFYGTTNVGFFVDKQTGKVDIERCSNIKVEQEEYQDKNGVKRQREKITIKSEVNPIGVIEPVLWLHRALTGK
jgi:GTPase SAR1 family protein